MEHQAGQYRASVTDGVLRLLQVTERYLTAVNMSPEGTEIRAMPYSSLGASMAASPVLMATWDGDGYANVDLDCGAQRWNGTKSLRWIRTGLYRAGFSKPQVDGLLRRMKAAGQMTCPRCY